MYNFVCLNVLLDIHFLHICVRLCVARSTNQGNTRASSRGTGKVVQLSRFFSIRHFFANFGELLVVFMNHERRNSIQIFFPLLKICVRGYNVAVFFNY